MTLMNPLTTATYRLTRDNTSPIGLMSSQRPSTDAMSVIADWASRAYGRTYYVSQDKDDCLVAALSFPAPDLASARTDFNALCAALGIQHEVVHQ